MRYWMLLYGSPRCESNSSLKQHSHPGSPNVSSGLRSCSGTPDAHSALNTVTPQRAKNRVFLRSLKSKEVKITTRLSSHRDLVVLELVLELPLEATQYTMLKTLQYPHNLFYSKQSMSLQNRYFQRHLPKPLYITS